MTGTPPNPITLIWNTLYSHFSYLLGNYTLTDNNGNNLPSLWVYPPFLPQGATLQAEGIEILINRSPDIRKNTLWGINYAKFYNVRLIDHTDSGELSSHVYSLLFKNILEGTEVNYLGFAETQEGLEKEQITLWIPESGINEFIRSGLA